MLLECAPAGRAAVGVTCEDPSLAPHKGFQYPIPCVPVLWVTPSHSSSSARISASTAVSTPAGSSQGDLEGNFKFSCSMTQLWSRACLRLPHPRGALAPIRVFFTGIPAHHFSRASLPSLKLCSRCFSLQCNTRFHTPSNISFGEQGILPMEVPLQKPNQVSHSSSVG